MATAAALPFETAIMAQVTAPEIAATAKRTANDVTVTTTNAEMMPIATDIAADRVANEWFVADVVNANDDAETATVWTNIQNTMEKFTVVFDGVRTTDTAVTDVTDGVLNLEVR